MQPNTLIDQIAVIIKHFAPLIIGFIIFVVGVILLINFRDMISQWYIGYRLKKNRHITELDIFEIDKERCLLIRINSFRLYFLGIDKENKLTGRDISLSCKRFINQKIIRVGRFI